MDSTHFDETHKVVAYFSDTIKMINWFQPEIHFIISNF